MLARDIGNEVQKRTRGLIDGGAHNRLSNMFEHVFKKNREKEEGYE